MPLTSSSPGEIRGLVNLINQSATTLTSDGSFALEEERRRLVLAAERLVLAARSPEETLFALSQQPAQNVALRCAIALDLPSALALDGSPRSATEIATATGAEKSLLKRILRACASTSLIAEKSEEHYAHTSLSRVLLSKENRDLLTLMFDYNGRALFALPEFLKRRNWNDAGSYADCAFMLGLNTSLPMWEFRDQNHECKVVFDSGMRSSLVSALSTGNSSGPFPFGDELKGEVTIVDVGGGRGQALEQIRADYPQIHGRFVLLDLQPVIDNAVQLGLPSWMETIAASFMEPLPLQGAEVYFIRRTLHNWDDDACRTILQNIAAAMTRPTSRLLITDMVVDDVGAVREVAWEDLNMMTIGGVERTERQWRDLLAECGLSVHKIWRTSPMEHGVIDTKLQ